MKYQWLITGLGVVALATLAFLNGLGGEFVYDDRAVLLNNPQLASPHSLSFFFTENLWFYSNIQDAYSASWRPLFFLTYWINYQLGLADELALHIISLVLHVLCALMLLVAIRRLMPDISPLAAGLAVCIFAVHPVHVEAVAWVGAFIHITVSIFLLAAFLTHDNFRRSKNATAAVASSIFFVLALLSNEMAVAFPLFILFYDRIRDGRFQLLRSMPYFVLLVLYAAARKQVLGESLPLTLFEPGLWLRMPIFLLEYLRHLIWPWPQPLYIQMPADWGISVGAIFTALVYAAMWIWVRSLPPEKRTIPLIAALWIASSLLPPMAAAFSPDARFALRALYLPSVGVCIFLAWLIENLPVLRRPLGIGLLSSLLLLATIVTMNTNRNWKDDGAVSKQFVTWNPAHRAGYILLGKFYERSNETEQALIQYEKAISRANPLEKAEPLQLLATLHGKVGNSQTSLELFKQLTVLKPKNAAAWNGMGNNYWALGQFEAAHGAYLNARKADPTDKVACYNLVLVLNQLGRSEEAARYTACAQGAR